MLRHLAWPVLTLVVGGLCGCITADPASDVESAVRVVATRSGIEPGWDRPPEELHPVLPDPLDIATATRIALERHPTLRAELAMVARSRAELADADRLPNPRLRFGVGIVTDGGGGSPSTAGLLAPLTALWTRPAEVAAARAELRTAVLELSAEAFATIEEVALACLAVHHGRRHEEIDHERVAAHEERVALVERLVGAGEAERTRLETARIGLARARAALAESILKRALAERALLERLGAADELGPCPAIDAESLVAALSPVPDEATLVDLVATRRLDVSARVERARAAGARLRSTRSSRFGNWGAGVGFEQNFQGREAVFPGLELEIPLFDAGGARIARDTAETERAVHEAEAALSAAWLDVRSAYAQLVAARARLDAVESEWLPAARERAVLVRRTQFAGEATRIDAIDAKLALLEAELEQNDALLSARGRLTTLVRAAGGSLAPLGPEERERLAEEEIAAGEPGPPDGGAR